MELFSMALDLKIESETRSDLSAYLNKIVQK